MQPNLYSPPLSDTIVDDISQRDGLLETTPLLSLDLSDAYIIQNLHTKVQMSVDYWNQQTGFNLRQKRIKNMRMIRGDQIDENALYHYQTPFKDNELYVGEDAIIAYITAATAGPEVYPAAKDKQSKYFAADFLKFAKGHAEKFDLDAELEVVAMDLLNQYLGVLKLEWKADYGKDGEIIPRAVNPAHLIVEKNARRGSNPLFICEVLKDSVEGLIAKFPKKEAEILRLFDIKRKGTQNVSKELAYREVWFTYYDKKNKPQEAVCWYINDLVLDKCKNPNWLYKGEGENFLDNPVKPYVPFNLFNDGNHWIDFTGPVEQAVPVQDILNKEGRQIIDNLSTANGFRIVLAGAMTDDALENLTGDPNQSVIVKAKQGQKIDDVYKQIEPHLVSEELIADKDKNRDVIHSILGTPSQFRGDDSDQTKTASEAQMIKNQASGRQDKIVRAFNRGLGSYYRLFAQMVCVWYTENHTITADGGDGAFDFLEMHQDKIKKGMTVRVYAEPSGDKARSEAIAQNAAELKIISPLDYYKMMHMDDPQKLFDNFVKFTSNPQSMAMDVLSDEQDRDALDDFSALMTNEKVDQRDDITPAYLDQFRKEMISDEFLVGKMVNGKLVKTPKSVKKNIIEFVNDAMIRLALRTELDEATNAPLPPEPLPPEVQATMPPQPPAPQPGMPPQGQPAMITPMPQGQPGQPPMQQPGMPQQPMAGAPPSVNPMPPVGIQGVMQQANAGGPNLNPNAQPSPQMDISQLTPR